MTEGGQRATARLAALLKKSDRVHQSLLERILPAHLRLTLQRVRAIGEYLCEHKLMCVHGSGMGWCRDNEVRIQVGGAVSPRSQPGGKTTCHAAQQRVTAEYVAGAARLAGWRLNGLEGSVSRRGSDLTASGFGVVPWRAAMRSRGLRRVTLLNGTVQEGDKPADVPRSGDCNTRGADNGKRTRECDRRPGDVRFLRCMRWRWDG